MKNKKDYLVAIFFTFFAFLMFASCDIKKEYEYYADNNNYISVVGTVSSINQAEDQSVLYLEFDNMSIQLSDNIFKVVGNNLSILQDNLNGKELQIGDTLAFVTAPRYFGDGYVMPIVSIKRDDLVLLEFEEGVNNFLRWIDSE